MSSKEFDRYLSQHKASRETEVEGGVDSAPFKMVLFSKNLLKRMVALKKCQIITDNFVNKLKKGNALDFGTSLEEFIPVPSEINEEVTAVNAFDDQARVANDLSAYLNPQNVSVLKVPKVNGMAQFNDSIFDTVLSTYVLEHNLNYKEFIGELECVLKPEGLLVVSLSTEHLLYRIFARRKVENDKERGHVYHPAKEKRIVRKELDLVFRRLRYFDV